MTDAAPAQRAVPQSGSKLVACRAARTPAVASAVDTPRGSFAATRPLIHPQCPRSESLVLAAVSFLG